MLWPRIALGLYFTGALGIAGIAKLEYPKQFAAALRRHDLLPQWSTTGFSRLFLCGEILLVCLLALGVTPLISATAVVVGFLVFLAARAKVLITKGGGACGCFGDTVTNQTDGANVATSIGYAAFAGLHYYVVATTAEPARKSSRGPCKPLIRDEKHPVRAGFRKYGDESVTFCPFARQVR